MNKRDLHTPFGEIEKIDEQTQTDKGKLGELLIEILQELYSVQKDQKDQMFFDGFTSGVDCLSACCVDLVCMKIRSNA